MKLQYRISKANDEYFYIGCKGGTAFFFAGTGKELKAAIKDIDRQAQEFFTKQVQKMEKTIAYHPARCEESLKDTQEQYIRYRSLVADIPKDYESPDVTKTLDDLKKCVSKIVENEKAVKRLDLEKKRAERDITTARQKLADYIPIGKREIIEEYAHTVGIPGTVLLLEGDLGGSFWTREEMEKSLKKKNDYSVHTSTFGVRGRKNDTERKR